MKHPMVSFVRYTNGAVKEALRHIIGVQLRNTATVGGSVWGRFGFSDVITLLLAMDTLVVLYCGPKEGNRIMTAMPARGPVVVAVGSAEMGNGDPRLGRILMKSFLYSLTQLDELPQTVLFFNGGVRMTTEGSESIEDLKALESQGVEILSCGTCLDFYGLKDKLLVGGITNMYVIAQTMAGAGNVVKI